MGNRKLLEVCLKCRQRFIRYHSKKGSPESTKSKWESVVGLEVHAQINSQSKLFSGSSTQFGSPVNSNVSLFDAAIPGTLPVLNKKCVEAGVLTALALSCTINPVSTFDRKHYFYADLPAGYQITQQRAPLATNGCISFQVFTPGVHKSPYNKSSRIKQIQLEQDSGKSLHDDIELKSLIDLNRAGIPLMEFVFEPDLTDGEEAAALIKELSLILTAINTCSCKMEEGALRIDANISVNRKGEGLGTRTEIKNIGSVRAVAKAVDHEISRQIALLNSGKEIINETRAWDSVAGVTVPMRDKEVKQDYRFMPEPNLLPLRLNVSCSRVEGLINVEDLRSGMPELPEETRQKLQSQYGLSSIFASILVSERELLQYFMTITNENQSRDKKLVAKILAYELLAYVNKDLIQLDSSILTPSTVGEIVDLLQCGIINIDAARNVMEEMISGKGINPIQIVEEKGWKQITDENELKRICNEAIENNPRIVKQYLSGKEKVFQSLVGYIAKATNRRANFGLATKILREMLQEKLDSRQQSKSG